MQKGGGTASAASSYVTNGATWKGVARLDTVRVLHFPYLMITLYRNGHALNWEEHWLPESGFIYERRAVRTLQVEHAAEDRWRFSSAGGERVEVYPDPGGEEEGVFPRPGHYALLVGDTVEGYLFLDPAGSQVRPAGSVDGGEFGIVPDQAAPVTARLNAALARLAASGGGTLSLGPGRYETGTVRMQSGTYLHLDAGAVLQATLDLEAHPLDEPGVWPEDLPRSLIPGTRRRLVYFEGVEDSGLTGPGVVCGRGSELRRRHPGPRAMMQLVRAVDCKRLRFEGVTLRDSEFWNTHLLHCEDVVFRGVKVLNEIPPPGWEAALRPGSRSVWNNADGINPDSSQRVWIEGCFFHTGDDCVPVKNTGCFRDRLADVSEITVRDCLMRTSTTALKVGTETRGGRIGNLRFERINIVETSRVIGLDLKDGAQAHDVVFRGIHVRRCNRPFDVWVLSREGQEGQTAFSRIRDVRLDDVRILRSGIEGENQTSHLMGRSAAFDVSGVTVRGLEIEGRAVRRPEDMLLECNEWVSGLTWR